MNEAGSDLEAGDSKVVTFRVRAAVARTGEPYLCDDERIALRRLLAMEERIVAAIVKIEHMEGACPTFKREIAAILRGE